MQDSGVKSGERRTGFVALPHFFTESMLLIDRGLRERPFVVTTGEGDRALILDTYRVPVRGLIGKTLGRLRRMLPLELPGEGTLEPEVLAVRDDTLYDMDRRMRLLLGEFSPAIESDRTGHYHIDLTATNGAARAARLIAERSRDWFQFSARLGVGSNKLIAYLAARSARPGRPLEIEAGREAEFYRPLSVLLLPLPWRFKEELYGAYNVRTIGDLAAFELDDMRRAFGARGNMLYEYSRGRASAEIVATRRREWLHEEIQVSSRLDVNDGLARARLGRLLDRLCLRLRQRGVFPGRFALEVIYQDDYRLREERRLKDATNLAGSLGERVRPHFERALARRVALKKIVLSCADFSPARWQLDLFGTERREVGRELQLSEACDDIRGRFGPDAIQRAVHLSAAES